MRKAIAFTKSIPGTIGSWHSNRNSTPEDREDTILESNKALGRKLIDIPGIGATGGKVR